jgi:hypothetical protein
LSTRTKTKVCIRCGNEKLVVGTKRCVECLATDATDQRNKRIRLKIAAFNAYGGPACACCGEREIGFLTIDHINGDGNIHRKQMGNTIRGDMIYSWLKARVYPPGFQVLCFNCNCGKNSNYGTCPHKGETLRFKLSS